MYNYPWSPTIQGLALHTLRQAVSSAQLPWRSQHGALSTASLRQYHDQTFQASVESALQRDNIEDRQTLIHS